MCHLFHIVRLIWSLLTNIYRHVRMYKFMCLPNCEVTGLSWWQLYRCWWHLWLSWRQSVVLPVAMVFDDNDNDNDNDNENNFIVMKLHFHSLYKSGNIPNEDCFSLAKKTSIMYNAQEKMVIILHDNEGMKPWLMGPNLCFTISKCQKQGARKQGNSAIFRCNAKLP